MYHNIDSVKDILIPLFTQFVGVFMAGVIALLVAKWQINRQNRDKQNSDDVYLKDLFDRVRLELRDNSNLVKARLTEAVEGNNSFDQQWAYIHSIADSFRFDSYHMIIRSGLFNNLPRNIQVALNAAYSDLNSLRNMIIMNEKAQSYYKLIGEDEIANRQIKNIQTYRATMESTIKSDFKIVSEENPYKQS